MNIRKLGLTAALVLAAAAGWLSRGWVEASATVQAQSNPPQQPVAGGVQKWKWPDSMDSPNAAGNIHNVLFQNSHVRLLEVTIQPGETEPMHGHKFPSVFAIDSPAPSFTDHALDGTNRSIKEQPDGQTYPQCRALPNPQAPHQATGDSIKKLTQYPSGN